MRLIFSVRRKSWMVRAAFLRGCPREDGEGIISAEISFGPIAEIPEAIPDRYRIADFSEQTYRQWDSNS
jgi:hypothetical protein